MAKRKGPERDRDEKRNAARQKGRDKGERGRTATRVAILVSSHTPRRQRRYHFIYSPWQCRRGSNGHMLDTQHKHTRPTTGKSTNQTQNLIQPKHIWYDDIGTRNQGTEPGHGTRARNQGTSPNHSAEPQRRGPALRQRAKHLRLTLQKRQTDFLPSAERLAWQDTLRTRTATRVHAPATLQLAEPMFSRCSSRRRHQMDYLYPRRYFAQLPRVVHCTVSTWSATLRTPFVRKYCCVPPPGARNRRRHAWQMTTPQVDGFAGPAADKAGAPCDSGSFLMD